MGIWIPHPLIKSKDRSRHDILWFNTADKTSGERCVSSQLRSPPFSLSFCSHRIPKQLQQTQGVLLVLPRCFISPLGASDLLHPTKKKKEFQHDSVWCITHCTVYCTIPIWTPDTSMHCSTYMLVFFISLSCQRSLISIWCTDGLHPYISGLQMFF